MFAYRYIYFKPKGQFRIKLYVFTAFTISCKIVFYLRIQWSIIFVNSFIRGIYCMGELVKIYFQFVIFK